MANALASTVHLVSADVGLREGCRRVLEQRGYCVHVHSDTRACAASRPARHAHCLVVDLDLPDGVAFVIQRLAHEAQPRTPVVCIATHASLAPAIRAIKAGATDVLSMPTDLGDVPRAVSAAIALGRQWQEHDARRARVRELVGRLTPRENSVLELLLEGQPNKLSAAFLGIQESTVKVHRSRLMRKLEVRSLIALIRLSHDFDDEFARRRADRHQPGQPGSCRGHGPLPNRAAAGGAAAHRFSSPSAGA